MTIRKVLLLLYYGDTVLLKSETERYFATLIPFVPSYGIGYQRVKN